jgi:Flp pilus assembly secretin CpaC
LAAAENTINVILDRATIANIPSHTATIVVGNPLIADATVTAGGMVVVTGKGYGVTNLIAVDQSGRVLAEQLVQVRSAANTIVIYHGFKRESYSCAPKCERRITLGDAEDYFNATLTETVNRSAGAAQSESAVGLARRGGRGTLSRGKEGRLRLIE